MRVRAFAILILLVLTAGLPARAARLAWKDNLTSDTTWSGPDTVVLSKGGGIVGAVVREGATLTIAPGTVVLFDRKSSLKTSGMIKAIGTEAAPIVFSSLADTAGGSPSPTDWSAISAVGDGRLVMEHCMVKYATYGIKLHQSGGDIRSCTIEDFGTHGINLIGVNYQPFKEINIIDCTVRQISEERCGQGSGVYAYGNMHLNVAGTVISDCYTGLEIIGCKYGGPTFEITCSQMNGHEFYGLYVLTGG